MWPRFELDVIVPMLREGLSEDRWAQWEAVACPALVVTGELGVLDRGVAEEMIRRRPGARLVEIARGGHDVHLDRPAQWRAALGGFLDLLWPAAQGSAT